MNRKERARQELARRRRLRAAIAAWFAPSPDPRHVVRRQAVVARVAIALGRPVSPALAIEVRRVAQALGAVPVIFCNRRLFKHFRPRHASDDEVERLAAALRRNPQKDASVLADP